MKINLEYPYSNDWKCGYLVTNPEGRKTVILYNSNTDRSSTAYARYLLAIKNGRYLTEDEEADHIDTDHENDDYDNLQILSINEHKEKTFHEQSGRSYNSFVCNNCGIIFNREIRKITKYTKYCSVECSRIKNKPPFKASVNYDEVDKLLSLGHSDNEIARLLSISSNSVLFYRKKNNILSPSMLITQKLNDSIDDIRLLLEQKSTKKYVAERYGISTKVLNTFIKKNNL